MSKQNFTSDTVGESFLRIILDANEDLTVISATLRTQTVPPCFGVFLPGMAHSELRILASSFAKRNEKLTFAIVAYRPK